MRVKYNSPFILTFTFICVIVMVVDLLTYGQTIRQFFTLLPLAHYGGSAFINPFFYFRLFSHSIGHADFVHLTSNLTLILLIGPILEEKYGGKYLLIMTLITVLITGLLNIFFFPHPLLGASGIAFMMIILGSFTNVESGYIPLTFFIIVVLFLGQEIFKTLESNNISEFAHIVGGLCGSFFGFIFRGAATSQDSEGEMEYNS